MQINPKSVWNQQGLTLVEMMIAMTIGLVLLGGVMTVLTSSKSTYRVNEAMARIQENARYAFQILSRDIRMAGYQGCVGDGITVANILGSKSDFLWRLHQPLEGFEATGATDWTPGLPGDILSPQGDRDILVVRGVENTNTSVLSHSSEPADLGVSPGSGLQTDDTVLVSNCQGAVIFQVTDVSTSPGQDTIKHDAGGSAPGNSSASLGRVFTGGEIGRISTKVYYIRVNPRGISSLYRRNGNLAADELVEGIENMQIQYGEDTNGDRAVDSYRTANLVADWENVVSVRIDLLVQSVEDGITGQPQTYTFNGVSVTPADRRLRQTFSTVISLRNRSA
ncbi:PilW family protein [Nitrosomonas sp.]|uniref:PilW family protein n=1 Tax=Nitrosomonas sp. TaxID=42353 RepID=UPI0025F7F3C4|nr:PilW family protein [Nitrosomonas sp.]MCC6916499.1 PilW family protein [Nitrosomonas sp.]